MIWICFTLPYTLQKYLLSLNRLSLTHSSLEISLTIVIWTSNTFENNFDINIILEKIFEGFLVYISPSDIFKKLLISPK